MAEHVATLWTLGVEELVFLLALIEVALVLQTARVAAGICAALCPCSLVDPLSALATTPILSPPGGHSQGTLCTSAPGGAGSESAHLLSTASLGAENLKAAQVGLPQPG